MSIHEVSSNEGQHCATRIKPIADITLVGKIRQSNYTNGGGLTMKPLGDLLGVISAPSIIIEDDNDVATV